MFTTQLAGHRLLFNLGVYLASLTAVACSDVKPTSDATAITGPKRNNDVGVESKLDRRTINDELADLADRAPAFGGTYVMLDGSWAVVTTAQARNQETLGAVDSMLKAHGFGGLHRFSVVHGRYNFRQLHNWDRKFASASHEGVLRAGIDSRDNRLHIGVIDNAVAKRVQGDLAALEIPDSGVVMSVEEPSVVFGSASPRESTSAHTPMIILLTARNDVIRGGLGVILSDPDQSVRTGPCTLAVVSVPQSLAPGALPDYAALKYGITSSHCTHFFGSNDNSVMSQGGVGFTDRIGHEIVDPPLFTNATNSQCPPGRFCRYSDAAQFELDHEGDRESFAPGTVYDADGGLGEVGTFNLTWTFASFPGMSVRKVGIGAGGVNGTIGQTCYSTPLYVFVNGGGSVDSGITLLCQNQFLGVGSFGDSGAPVMFKDPETGRWSIIGVINSGNGQGTNNYSAWDWVWQELRQAWDSPPNRRLCPLLQPGTNCVF